MNFSQYTNKYQTRSFYVGTIRAAVEQHESRYGGLGSLEVVVTHMSPDDFTAQAHAQSSLDGVIIEVERIAGRLEQESRERMRRNAELRERASRGEISDEELDRELCWA